MSIVTHLRRGGITKHKINSWIGYAVSNQMFEAVLVSRIRASFPHPLYTLHLSYSPIDEAQKLLYTPEELEELFEVRHL